MNFRTTVISKTSVALGNLRSFVVLPVISFHSVLAYLGSNPVSPLPFDSPPYPWLSTPDPADLLRHIDEVGGRR